MAVPKPTVMLTALEDTIRGVVSHNLLVSVAGGKFSEVTSQTCPTMLACAWIAARVGEVPAENVMLAFPSEPV